MVAMKKYTGLLGKNAAAVLVLIILVAVSISAQLPTGLFLGTVKDSTGGAVAGATVTATNTDTGFTRTGTTGDDGAYRFPAMPVGKYEIKVTKEGFQTLSRTGLTLDVGQDATVDLTLQVGSTSQSVVVTGEAPQVDTTSSSFGSLVNEDKVTDLPLNGRNWTDLTLMQPGVTQINALQSFGGAVGTPGYNGTLYSTNGGTDRSNTFMLDGADMRTMIGFNNTSATGTSLGVDGIKEYKVVSVLPSAEYGLTGGSQTTIVSKSGTNQWHGDAFDFLRNASLDANPYNVTEDTSNLNASQCGSGYVGANNLQSFPCKRTAPFQRNNFGGAFGGPVKKDKLFFYAVYEGIRSRSGQELTRTTLPTSCFATDSTGATPLATKPDGTPVSATRGVIPALIKSDACVPGSSASPITVPALIQQLGNYFPEPNVPLTTATLGYNWQGRYSVPIEEDYGQARVDYTFGANDSMFFRYTQDIATTLPVNGGSLDPGTGGGDPRALNNDHSAGHFGTLSETHIFTPTLLNTVRLSYSRNLQHLIPQSGASNIPGLPNEPISVAAGTLFITDSGNLYQQPGNANPGAIPPLLIPGATGCTAGTATKSCYSTYGTVAGLSNNVGPGVADSNDYTFSDDVFWTKGKHAFKFGTLMNRFDWFSLIVFTATGSVSFPGSAASTLAPVTGSSPGCIVGSTGTSCPLAAYFEGVYSSIGRAIPNSLFPRGFRGYTYGFYAQDDYKVLPRVTLNLGLRYEFATVPYEFLQGANYSLRFPFKDQTGTQGVMFRNPSLHNFSPRIGFAWDIFGNGKTSMRGGAGIYYDVGTYGNLEQSNSISTPPISGTVTFSNPDLSSFSCCTATTTYRPGTGGTVNPGQVVTTSASSAFSVPLPSVTNQAVQSVRTVDYNLDQPSLLQRSLGIDQQLPFGMALSVSYVGAQSWHLYQEREGNPIAWFAATPGTKPLSCPSDTVSSPHLTCFPVTIGSNGLPFYCSSSTTSVVQPTAAAPCPANSAVIPCTTTLTPGVTGPPGTPGGASCPGRINPRWNGVSNVTTSGNNYYNSLQIVLNKRTTHGLQFQASYTWQKLLDNGTGQSTSENTTNPHQFPTAGGGPGGIIDRGPSQYNATDNIRGNLIYRAPDLVKADTILGKVVNGWGFAAIPSFQTGYPMSITIGGRSLDSATFATDRVDLCPNYNPSTFKTGTNTGDRGSSTFFNINMICLPVAGTLGNSPKGLFTGPGLFSLSTSFTKDTKVRWLGEAGNVQFRFELFNTLNHPNFGAPTASVFTLTTSASCPQGGSLATLTAIVPSCGVTQSSTAGHDSLTTTNAMRQMQVSLKIVF